MSAHVTNILAGINSTAATVLGATWHALPHVYDLSKNNNRTAAKGYGGRPAEANPPETQVVRAYTLDHTFELALTESIARAANDVEVNTALGTLYDKADEIFKSLVNTKIGLPTVVLNVSAPALAAPERFEKEKFVALRMQFTVKYRSALT